MVTNKNKCGIHKVFFFFLVRINGRIVFKESNKSIQKVEHKVEHSKIRN